MARIVDAHVHIMQRSDLSFSPEQLIAYMDGPYRIAGEERRVDVTLVQPTADLTLWPGTTFREQHALVIEATRAYPGRLAGNFIFNPRLDLDEGIAVLTSLVEEERFKAVKLHPAYHSYHPVRMRDRVWPIVEAAQKLEIAVMIHTGDPPFSFPASMAPLIEAFPGVRFVIAHMGVQRTSYAEEAIDLARAHENVWLEFSCAQLNQIKDAVRSVGASRLIFGTDSPHHVLAACLSIVEALCFDPPIGLKLSEADRERIYGGNATEVFRL